MGKKYKVEHGIGIYIGYEAFNPGGRALPMIPKSPPEDFNGRSIFRLMPGHTWAFDNHLYATWDKDIHEYEK